MVKWIGKLSLLLERLRESWMNMQPFHTMVPEQRGTNYRNSVTQENVLRTARSEATYDP